MTPMEDADELLDLVDDQDQKIGTILRKNVPGLGSGDGFVRAASILLINGKGELWVPRRTSHKKIAPNGLDFGASEHVKSGEAYDAAAIRGMQEELGIVARNDGLIHIGKLHPSQLSVPYFEAIFLYNIRHAPDYNPDDFVSFEWLMPDALRTKLQGGEVAKKGLLPALELLVSYNKKRSKEV